MGCVSLNTVTFSAATTPLLTIKTKAFKNCEQLVSLTLSNSMPTLESGAFANCTMLRSITIPSLMSMVDDGVFSGIANLREVTFLGVPPENLENAGLSTDVKIRYPKAYAEDWEGGQQLIVCFINSFLRCSPNAWSICFRTANNGD